MFGPFSRQVGDGNNAPETQLSWLLAYICQRAADSFGSETDMWKGQVRLQSRGVGVGDKLVQAVATLFSNPSRVSQHSC